MARTKLSRADEVYVRENAADMPLEQLVADTGVSGEAILAYLETLPKGPTRVAAAMGNPREGVCFMTGAASMAADDTRGSRVGVNPDTSDRWHKIR